MVGCVVVRDGEIVGQGYHRRLGGPHAEIEALRQAGERARGGDLYVTLEPCSHHGRTPPCTDAILAAGLRRVVACHRDPDPRVSGGGFALLQRAGIEVESRCLVERAVKLNWRFLVAAVHGRPAVTVKWAMSLDGKIATRTGHSQWISSPGGRRWGLAQREEHDAILVGSGTALADDPRLDRRLNRAGRPNVRVVLDRRLRMPPEAKLFDLPGEVVIYTEADSSGPRQALEERGAVVRRLLAVEPRSVLDDLYQRGVRSVLVEGGSHIAGAFVADRLFDRIAVDCAPKLIAGDRAPGPLAGHGFATLDQAPSLEDLTVERRDGDVILSGFRSGCLRDLYNSVDG